ncbi:MAG: Co2+/Mg2+ efflux protein ApaG [Pseudomonadota bacterium]
MYKAVTHNIEVTVSPTFLPDHSEPEEQRFVWAYEVEIRNGSAEKVRLRNRHWRIIDGTGKVEEVRGPGVVGEQPVLLPGAAFRYTSGCPLTTESGFMVGRYEMERDTGERFWIDVPPFSLDLPDATRTVN